MPRTWSFMLTVRVNRIEEGYINLGQEMFSCVGKNPKLTSENWVGQVAILLSFLFPTNSPPKFAIIGHTPCHDSFGNIYAEPDVYKIHNTRRCVEISEKIYFEPRSVLQEVLLWHPKWNFNLFIPHRLFTLLFRQGRTPPGGHPLQQHVVC